MPVWISIVRETTENVRNQFIVSSSPRVLGQSQMDAGNVRSTLNFMILDVSIVINFIWQLEIWAYVVLKFGNIYFLIYE